MKINQKRYTHIIVGAGSAGCLLANRLTSRPQNSVLLIEAGAWDDGFWLKLPVGYYKTIKKFHDTLRVSPVKVLVVVQSTGHAGV